MRGSDNSTEKVSEDEESTESTTGHFLSKATFQPTKTVGTSLNSSSENGKDLERDNGNEKEVMTANKTNTDQNENTNFGYSRCTAGQFECLNGTSLNDGGACISLSQQCDSIFDCSDNSDESDCEMLGCPGHFQCSDGSCLARSLVCDKILHCLDGSDESENLCGNEWKCGFDEFACSENGPCLPGILQCDGIPQCSNQADETNCPDTCKNDEFYCSWQHKCIPETFVCDGKIDCSGGEDERSCDCPEGQFKCNTGRCVPGHYVCDGQPQCADLSDDWDCYNLTTIQKYTNETTNPNDNTGTALASALQIRKTDGKFAFVCYENWNLNHADSICKNFGFVASKDYSAIQVDTTNMSVVNIDHDYHPMNSMLTNLNQTDSCLGDKIVALECKKYGKYFLNESHICFELLNMCSCLFQLVEII